MTTEKLRFDIAEALAPHVDYDLFQLFPRPHRPGCPATPDACTCANAPYLSDSAWTAIAPIIRQIQQGAAQ